MIAPRLRPLAALALVLAAAALAAAASPPTATAAAGEPPRPDARAWVLIDARDGQRLAGHAASRPLPVGSATKLMTALLTLRELKPGKRLTAARYVGVPAESVLGLRPGERLTVRDLLLALLLPSANDAAVTLAQGVAGSVPAFVEMMNAAARRLGLSDTRFTNPIGLDQGGNRSSARDLATLARRLRRSKRFRRIVDTPAARLRSGDQPREVTSRNDLLTSFDWVDGVKTGQTQGAGFVLVASGSRKGVPLVSVVLGAPSEAARDAGSLGLLDWGFSRYPRRTVVRRGAELAAPALRYRDDELALRAGRRLRVAARGDQPVETRVIAPEEVDGPIERGERLGRVVVTVDGRRAGTVPLVASRSVGEASLFDRVSARAPVPLIALGAIVIGIGFLAVRRRGTRDAPGPRTPEERRASRNERTRGRQEESS